MLQDFKLLLKNDIQGFSLVEVMISVVILSFTVLGVYSLTDNGISTKDRVIREDRDYFQSYTAMTRFQDDIQQIWSPLYYSSFETQSQNDRERDTDPRNSPENERKFVPTKNFPRETARGHAVPIFESEQKTELTLFTTSNRRKIQDQKQSRYSWIRYSLEDDKKTEATLPNLVRQVIAEDPYQEQINWDKVQTQVLLKKVKTLGFEFWDPSKERWVEGLRTLPENDRLAPKAIKISITWVNSSEEELQQVRIFRPLWPFFDAAKDQKEREEAVKPKPNSNRQQDRQGDQNGV